MACRYCGHTEYRMTKRKAGDGHIQILNKCANCKQTWNPPFTKKENVPNLDVLEWDEPMPVRYCQRCGKEYAQAHHYFPQSIARKAGINPDDWPIEDLCNECHGKWHTHVTPGLVKRDW